MIRKLLNLLLNFINNSDIGKLNSSTREEWIIAQIKNIPKNSIVLDAGAGLMPYKKYFDKNSKSDSKSNELLCFGYHVLAEKI